MLNQNRTNGVILHLFWQNAIFQKFPSFLGVKATLPKPNRRENRKVQIAELAAQIAESASGAVTNKTLQKHTITSPFR